MMADNYLKVVLIITGMILAPIVPAAEIEINSYVTRQYKKFNEDLLGLDLSQALILIEKERFRAFSSFVRKVKVNNLWDFYSKKNKASSMDCDTRSLSKIDKFIPMTRRFDNYRFTHNIPANVPLIY